MHGYGREYARIPEDRAFCKLCIDTGAQMTRLNWSEPELADDLKLSDDDSYPHTQNSRHSAHSMNFPNGIR
jgi:hypothetical protein